MRCDTVRTSMEERKEKMSWKLTRDYQVPIMEPVYSLPDGKTMIGFNYAKSTPTNKRGDMALHFYLDDYQFERVWNNQKKYMEILGAFSYVIQPDFSVWRDKPFPEQLYAHYKKQYLGALWQSAGITVVPCIGWAGVDTYDFCFDGVPAGGIVSVSSVGTQNNPESKRLFLLGYEEMQKRLHPSTVLFYGKVPEQINKTNVVQIPPLYTEVRKVRIEEK